MILTACYIIAFERNTMLCQHDYKIWMAVNRALKAKQEQVSSHSPLIHNAGGWTAYPLLMLPNHLDLPPQERGAGEKA